MTTATHVRSERRDGIVVIRIENPPVNVLSRPTRSDLLAALEDAERDPEVVAVVITGAPNFSAGADLAEFDSGEGLAEPTLHLTIAGMLDSMSKPSVAAITGAALGGGLELALACSARVGHPSAVLGLPESTLGFMPGAGGTQRLPRAVGIEAALDLIVTGRTIDADNAAVLGLLDDIHPDPVDAASRMGRTLAGHDKPRLRDRTMTEQLAEPLVDAARRSALRNPRTTPGVRSALEALRSAVTSPFDVGLAHEFELFEGLALSPGARAARYRFLSDRASGRIPHAEQALPPVRTAAVVGAGTMGRGIALALLAAGIPTRLIDMDAERAEAGVAAISSDLDRAVARGRLTPQSRQDRLDILSAGIGVEAASDADLVVEAVFESLSVKMQVFEALDAVARPGAVLASNTSSLDLDRIAAVTSRPEFVVGLHFFSPANIMRLVEVIEGAATSAATLAAAVAFVKRIGKLPVIAQVGPGFIGNRIFDQYVRQANILLSTGASPQRIDRALEAWGMAMGPFRVLDVVGNDIPAQGRRESGVQDPAYTIADRLVAEGYLGRKTGLGWYDYSTDPPGVNSGLEITPSASQVDDDEIVRRCSAALVNEAFAVLADGIAGSVADIDTVLVHGYGFPARRGGPLFAAEQYGWDRLVRDMNRWRLETGDPFWMPHELLTERARS